MSGDTDHVPVVRLDGAHGTELSDPVVVEEPLEIRVGGESMVVTMRTPGDDLDLAAGFMLTEGWIRSMDEVATLAYCPDERDPSLRNIVDARLVGGVALAPARRMTWANSSCGLCGKATLDSIRQESEPIESDVRISREVVCGLPDSLASGQDNFRLTGGIHAAGLFDLDGRLLAVREDIGRHNAADKVIGTLLRSGELGTASVMMVSGRLGFEIAQKALVARIPVVASVSAPSSLAIDLARDFGMTTIGFLRGTSMNIYTHPERIGVSV
jgi:FdhD protein